MRSSVSSQIRTITSSDESDERDERPLTSAVSVESLTSTIPSSSVPIQDKDTFNKAMLWNTYLNIRRDINNHTQKDVSSLFYSTSVSEDDFYIDHCIHFIRCSGLLEVT